MRVFVYAYINFFDNEVMLKTALAEDVMRALNAIFRESFPESENWDSTDMAETWASFKDPEDVVSYFLEGEIGITVPVPVEELGDTTVSPVINPYTKN